MDKPILGWIGTGVIGGSCASRALAAGYRLIVTTRTKSKADNLLTSGAIWAESAKEVALQADVVFSTVGYPRDVREIVFGDAGVFEGFKGREARAYPATYIDMTTSSPELANEIFHEGQKRGIATLDAPVSGGDVGARNGTLSIMVGGDRNDFDRVAELLSTFGTNVRYHGAAGAGQRAKITNQILIAGNMIGVCEALLYAYKAGLDLEETLKSVSSGAAGSWSLSNLAPRILRGDYAPGFYVEHFVKDLGLALDDAKRLNLALPGVALASQLYLALMAQGGSRFGTQALVKALAKLSNVDRF